MNFRTTALLFGLLLGMLWLFGLMLAWKKAEVDKTLVFPSLNAQDTVADIDHITVVHKPETKGGETQEWELIRKSETKTEEVWDLKVKGIDKVLRAYPGRAGELISELRKARKEEDQKVKGSRAEYGLEDPRIVVTLKGRERPAPKLRPGRKKDKEEEPAEGKAKEWKLLVGKSSNDQSLVYVTSSDEPRQIFAVKRSTLVRVFDTLNAVRSPVLLDFKDAATVKLTGKKEDAKKDAPLLQLKKIEGNTWLIEEPKSYGLADWEGGSPVFTKKDDKDKEKDKDKKTEDSKEPGVRNLIEAVRQLRVKSEDDFIGLKESFATYGLEEGQETLRIQVTENNKDQVLLVGKDGTIKEDVDNKKVDVKIYYVRLAGDLSMAKIRAKEFDALFAALKDPGTLRSRDILTHDTRKIDLVKVKRGDHTIVLGQNENQWFVSSSTDAKWRKAEEFKIDRLLTALKGARDIKEFMDSSDDDKLGLSKSRLTIELWTGGVDAEAMTAFVWATVTRRIKTRDKDPDPPKLKKDAKSTITLFFGDEKDDVVYIKREVLIDLEPPSDDKKKTPNPKMFMSRLAIPKSVWETLTPKETSTTLKPTDPALAYVDPSLPRFLEDRAIIEFMVDRPKDKGKIDAEHRLFSEGGWYLRSTPVSPDTGTAFIWASAVRRVREQRREYKTANSGAIDRFVLEFDRLRADRWMDKFEESNAKKFGLDNPILTITITTKKVFQPDGVRALMGALTLIPLQGPLAAVGVAANSYPDKGAADTTVIRIGSEIKEDKLTYHYAHHSGKDNKDLVFLVPQAMVKELREADVRDKSGVAKYQGQIDAAMLGAAAPGAFDALLLTSPLVGGGVKLFDPAKVKDIKLLVRSSMERREFHFEAEPKKAEEKKEPKVEDKKDPKAEDKKDPKAGDKKDPKAEDKKDPKAETKKEEKKEEKKAELPTWKDKSKFSEETEFKLDSDKVNGFLERLTDGKTMRLVDRIALFTTPDKSGKRPSGLDANSDHKLDAKQAVIRLELTVDDGTKEGKKIVLTVGADYDMNRFRGYYAHISTWDDMVFLTPAGWVNELRHGLPYFGKDRATITNP